MASTKTLNVQLRGEDPKMKMKLNGDASVVVKPGLDGNAQLSYAARLRVDGSLAAMGGPVIRTILSDTITQFVQVVGGHEVAARRSPVARLIDALTSGGDVPSARKGGPEVTTSQVPASTEVRGLYLDEFTIGQRWVTPARTITEADLVGFAGLSATTTPCTPMRSSRVAPSSAAGSSTARESSRSRSGWSRAWGSRTAPRWHSWA